jgi:hypothetical protein
MKRLMLSAFAVVVLLAGATSVWRSHSSATNFPVGIAGVMSVQELGAAAALSKLPVEEFEDHSLVYSTPPKR